ncbi:HAUS augmin-like complex subunit 4 isoform X2 [Apostichopus japonicus]|uniref:HAUS augmin-like complex subunit 4 isoform X2 n=1 Tax=Stichopus japonicus TaxID=307972 RepID=UPI003AB3C43D
MNMTLPTHLTGIDLENYPGLTDLLGSLSKHLNNNGLLKSSEEDIKQVEENLEKEKHFYLQQHILHCELHEIMIDGQIPKQQMQEEAQTEQYNNALRECMSTAEAYNYLYPRPDTTAEGTSTLLGLMPDDLMKSNPNMKRLPVLQQQFIPQLESRLKHKCEEIASCNFSSHTGGSEQLAFAKATRLPDILKQACTQLEDEREKSRLDKAIIKKQFWQLCYALTEALSILEQLITKHRLRLQTEKDSVTTDWLSTRCHAMHLKIRVFRSRVMCDMYRPEAVTALEQIREHLKYNIQEKESEQFRLDQALQAYRSTGMGFGEIVQEFEQLQNALTSKRWALKELKQSLTEETEDWRV